MKLEALRKRDGTYLRAEAIAKQLRAARRDFRPREAAEYLRSSRTLANKRLNGNGPVRAPIRMSSSPFSIVSDDERLSQRSAQA
jgi:hypothetical protein